MSITLTITLTIKLLNGDLLSTQYNTQYNTTFLYRSIWRLLPHDIRPKDVWRLMLFRIESGEWIRPNTQPLLTDGEVLALFIEHDDYHCQTHYIHQPDYDWVYDIYLYRIELYQNDSLLYSNTISCVYDNHCFYLEGDYVVVDDLDNDRRRIAVINDDPHYGWNRFLDNVENLSHCAREYFHYILSKCPINDLLTGIPHERRLAQYNIYDDIQDEKDEDEQEDDQDEQDEQDERDERDERALTCNE